MRVLELFSGIGAIAAACRDTATIVCAVDINQAAMQVYRANFNCPTLVQEIASLSDGQLAGFNADLWWMSPPCQPFTRRGLHKDLEDARTKPLLRLIAAIEKIRPANIALENVVGFEKSRTHDRLVEALHRAGYQFASAKLCSSEFGLPNLRPRFYLVASKAGQPNLKAPAKKRSRQAVAEFLDSENELARWQDRLFVDAQQIAGYQAAVNVVNSSSNLTRCFTSAYGRSIVRSGSYLKTACGYRRFSPSEECRLLGFPGEFSLPAELSVNQLWKLLGNSVSIPCARHVLGTLNRDG